MAWSVGTTRRRRVGREGGKASEVGCETEAASSKGEGRARNRRRLRRGLDEDAVRGFRAEDIGTTELDECVDFSETFQRMLHKDRVFNRWRCRTPSEHATWAAFVDRGGPWQQHRNRERWRRCHRPQLSAAQRRERWLTPCERAAMGRARPSFLDRMPCRLQGTQRTSKGLSVAFWWRGLAGGARRVTHGHMPQPSYGRARAEPLTANALTKGLL